MGRKLESIKALKFLENKGIDVALVVALPPDVSVIWKKRLWDYAVSRGYRVVSNNEVYKLLKNKEIKDIDLVISYLYPYRVKKPLLELPEIGAINFHPAPLPELRGIGGYNVAILEGFNYYGVSAHYMSEEIDSGDIIKVVRFPIDPEKETAYSLEKKTRPYLLKLFYEVISDIIENGKPEAKPQGKGRYITKKEFESMKLIKKTDTPEMIERKIRAFFYPPYPGALIEINGKKYTVISNEILKDLGEMLHSD